jgi:hypothetical protein
MATAVSQPQYRNTAMSTASTRSERPRPLGHSQERLGIIEPSGALPP